MIKIKGWQKVSLIDFPPYTVSVIFLGGCNFRCSFCHNPDLVLRAEEVLGIELDDILEYIEKKKMWIDGVCITGGEPTLHKDLPEMISKIREKGMKIKLDTNGTDPEMVSRLIDKKLVDHIAMDIKSSLEKYGEVCGVTVNKEKIKKSISLIRDSKISYEFRTTVVPGLVGKEDISKIGKMLQGSKKYVIQNFRGGTNLIDDALKDIEPFSSQELEEMKKSAEEYLEEVELRQ